MIPGTLLENFYLNFSKAAYFWGKARVCVILGVVEEKADDLRTYSEQRLIRNCIQKSSPSYLLKQKR